jgi:hypothetical protein
LKRVWLLPRSAGLYAASPMPIATPVWSGVDRARAALLRGEPGVCADADGGWPAVREMSLFGPVAPIYALCCCCCTGSAMRPRKPSWRCDTLLSGLDLDLDAAI